MDAAAYWPPGQAVQPEAPCEVAYCPAAQLSHATAPSVLKVPAEHRAEAAASPGDAQYAPSEQSTHAAAPLAAWTVPAAHREQVLAPAAE